MAANRTLVLAHCLVEHLVVDRADQLEQVLQTHQARVVPSTVSIAVLLLSEMPYRPRSIELTVVGRLGVSCSSRFAGPLAVAGTCESESGQLNQDGAEALGASGSRTDNCRHSRRWQRAGERQRGRRTDDGSPMPRSCGMRRSSCARGAIARVACHCVWTQAHAGRTKMTDSCAGVPPG